MAKAFLFHNPRCSKSRQALKLLEKEKENFEVFMYLDEKLEKNFLKERKSQSFLRNRLETNHP
jgi:arsenate reductase-like glutaredoxin family protein